MRLSPANDVLRAVAAALLLGLPCLAQAATPSFLCSKARTWVEKTICASERLSDLDLELATVYARLLRVSTGNAEKVLTSDQHRWWATRDECRRQVRPGECLETRYVQRIALLKARPDYTELRPGAVELPPESLSAVGEGWSKSLSRYLKAMRACLRRAPAAVKVIGAGWEEPGEEPNVGLRMRGPRDEIWVCTAARNGSRVLSFHEANIYEPLPPEGPLFYPDPTAPPADACGTPVQVLDEYEAPVGWLGPQCAQTATQTPAETPSGTPPGTQ